MRAAEIEDVGDARGEHAGLAGAGAGQHQNGAVQCFHRLALLRVEVGEIGRRPGAERARGNAARNRLRAQWRRVVAFRLGHVVRLRGGICRRVDSFHSKDGTRRCHFRGRIRTCLPRTTDLA